MLNLVWENFSDCRKQLFLMKKKSAFENILCPTHKVSDKKTVTMNNREIKPIQKLFIINKPQNMLKKIGNMYD